MPIKLLLDDFFFTSRPGINTSCYGKLENKLEGEKTKTLQSYLSDADIKKTWRLLWTLTFQEAAVLGQTVLELFTTHHREQTSTPSTGSHCLPTVAMATTKASQMNFWKVLTTDDDMLIKEWEELLWSHDLGRGRGLCLQNRQNDDQVLRTVSKLNESFFGGAETLWCFPVSEVGLCRSGLQERTSSVFKPVFGWLCSMMERGVAEQEEARVLAADATSRPIGREQKLKKLQMDVAMETRWCRRFGLK